MTKATIHSKTGATITIEGSHEEVSKIINDFELKASTHETKVGNVKKQVQQKEEKKRQSTSGLVIQLREEGFFDKAKSLGEVSTKLEDLGFLCPTTTLSGIVLGLVQKRMLRRKKIDGKWVYGK